MDLDGKNIVNSACQTSVELYVNQVGNFIFLSMV